jgi:glutathione peroxidase
MKQGFFLIGVIFLPFLFLSSIYDIQVESVNGDTISLSNYTNKKILITVINAAEPDPSQLEALDSLQKNDTSLVVIAVPANEFGGPGSDSAIAAMQDSLGLEILITKSSYVTKGSGDNQVLLFKWLTDVNENSHFDTDVETVGKFFIVSKTGILYSVLSNDVPADILDQVLDQQIDQ